MKAYAFRGATHYLSAADGGAYLAIRAAGRQWERRSWRDFYALEPEDWPGFRAAVREALTDGPLTVAEIGRAVTGAPAYRHLRPVFDDGAGTLVKPLTWQGDMSFGPRRDGQATFQRLDRNPRWAGVWDLDEAGPHAIEAYVRAYGPTTLDHVHHWLAGNLSAGAGRLRSWLSAMGGRFADLVIEGEPALVLREDLDELRAARATDAVRLLPGHDQWVMGPGTQDPHVVPPARRTPVTRRADLVVAGGVVSGTWRRRGQEVDVTWFGERGAPPRTELDEQVARLSSLLGTPLSLTVERG